MKTLHMVLLCLMIFAFFSYTATTLDLLIQPTDDFKHFHNFLPKGKPGSIGLGDPIEDPKPHAKIHN